MNDNKQLFSRNNQSAVDSGKSQEALMRHKAMKYHVKIQDYLNREYVMKGKPIPAGYEQYMHPFGSSQSGGGDVKPDDEASKTMRHKAMKYHYKIQNLLNNEYVMKGQAIPHGYESYMKPFQG